MQFNFKNRGEIIEILYRIKETLESKPYKIDDIYLSYVFDLIENVIPNSKYFDDVVEEMIFDVIDVIFNEYAEIKRTDVHLEFLDDYHSIMKSA